MSVNKYGGQSSIQTVFKNRDVKDPKGVKIVHSLLQKAGELCTQISFSFLYFALVFYFVNLILGFNPCEKNNGGCQHLCIVTKVSESDNIGFRCACHIGYALMADLKTCGCKFLHLSEIIIVVLLN